MEGRGIDRAVLVAMDRLGRLLRGLRLAQVPWTVRDAIDFVCRRVGRPPLHGQLDGLRLAGYLRHRGFLSSLLDGTYERLYRRLYVDSLRPGAIVVDGGAHIGLYTLLASRHVGGTGRVFAFEPDAYNFDALRLNVERAGCGNVTMLRKAVSSAVGTVAFYQNQGTVASSLIDRAGVGRCRETPVEATTLDRELGDCAGAAVVVKLDVEGAEVRALRGMRRLAESAGSIVVFLEVNPSALRDGGAGVGELLRELDTLGLVAHFIDEAGSRLVPVAEMTSLPKGNIYCVRRRPEGMA